MADTPGEFWRRTARLGALSGVVATLMPLIRSSGSTLSVSVHVIESYQNSFPGQNADIFSIFLCCALLSGPMAAVLCSRSLPHFVPHGVRWLGIFIFGTGIVMWILLLANWPWGYSVWYRHMPSGLPALTLVLANAVLLVSWIRWWTDVRLDTYSVEGHGDPGASWRKRARLAGIIATVAVLISGTLEDTCWEQCQEFWKSIKSRHIGWLEPNSVELALSCLFPSVILTPVAILVVASPFVLDKDSRRYLYKTIVFVLPLVTVLPTAYAAASVLTEYSTREQLVIALMIPHIYLMAAAVGILASRSACETAQMVFAACVVPLVSILVAWCCALQLSIFNSTISSGSTRLLSAILGAAGSFMMLAGWLGWWRAVATASAKTASSASVSAVQ